MNLNPDQKRRIRLIAGIVTSVLLVITGVLFCLSCYSIYRSEESQMFTYERIGAAFDKIAPAVWITLGVIVIDGVLALALPVEEKKKSARRPDAAYALLAHRAELTYAPEALVTPIRKERCLRKIFAIGTAVLLVLGTILSLVYLFDKSHFMGLTSAECTEEVLDAMLFCGAMLLPGVICYVLFLFGGTRSRVREIGYLKDVIKQNGTRVEKNEEKQVQNFFRTHENTITRVAQIGLLAVSIVLIVLGISNGGMLDVLKKAAEICAECIGLG